MIFDITEAEHKIGYVFKDKNLLRQAFTHATFTNEKHQESNERLEFLGDSVLGFLAAEWLYLKHPGLPEGGLTKLKAAMVSSGPLCLAVRETDVYQHMLLGEGEKHNTPSQKMLSNLFEAVIGAVYLDGGIAPARKLCHKFFRACENKLCDNANQGLQPGDSPVRTAAGEDCKSRLLELCQKRFKQRVKFEILERSGPAHRPKFVVQAVLGSSALGIGSGGSKRAAEQQAAQRSFSLLPK